MEVNVRVEVIDNKFKQAVTDKDNWISQIQTIKNNTIKLNLRINKESSVFKAQIYSNIVSNAKNNKHINTKDQGLEEKITEIIKWSVSITS